MESKKSRKSKFKKKMMTIFGQKIFDLIENDQANAIDDPTNIIATYHETLLKEIKIFNMIKRQNHSWVMPSNYWTIQFDSDSQ